MREVLARCEELRAETGGYFDVRAGGRLDPSGYVKGWAVQRAAAFGCGRFLIEAGGDMVLRGSWRVGIRHPYERGALAAAITVADCAVATSGAYERGPHILDPFTGRPATGLSSVTVIGRDLGTVDAYATAAFAAGDPRLDGAAGGDDDRRRSRVHDAGLASKRNAPGSTVQPPSQCASARGAIVTSTATSSPGSASTISKPASQRGGRSTALSGREA